MKIISHNALPVRDDIAMRPAAGQGEAIASVGQKYLTVQKDVVAEIF